jgi:hypothetical protein
MKVDLYIDPRSYVHSPQYVLTVASPPHRTSVHLVLTRHHTGATHHVTSRKGSVDSYKTYAYPPHTHPFHAHARSTGGA